MTDTPPADDWWLASDGKFYPPETHPDYVAPVPAPSPMPAPPPAVPPGPRAGPPTSPVTTDAASPSTLAAPAGGPPSAPRRDLMRFWWVPVLVGLAGVGTLLYVILGSESDDNVRAADPTATEEPVSTEGPTVVDEPTAAPEPDEPTPEAREQTPTPIPSPEPPPGAAVDTTPEGSASIDDPAAFGEVYGDADWRITVLDVIDAEEANLLASYSDPIPERSTAAAVIYEMTYVGPELSAQGSLYLEGLGAGGTYDTFSGCSLDFTAMEEQGLDSFFSELVFGQSWVGAECMFVPEGEVDGLVIAAETFTRFDPVYFRADGSRLPRLEPVSVRLGPPDVITLDFGQMVEWDGEWEAAILGTADPVDTGWLPTYIDGPPDGFTYIAVVYEVTNIGSDDSFDPFDVAARATFVHRGSFDCFLDDEALAAEGMAGPFDDVELGDTKTSAACILVPLDEIDDLLFRLSNFSSFDNDDVYYSD